MNTRRITAALTLVATAALVGACSQGSGPRAQQRSDILDDPSPDMTTLSARDVDVANQYSSTIDNNVRQIADDWNRLWLMDRPSRMNRDRAR